MNSYQFQNSIPLTPIVKKLVIINVVVWFFGVLILQRFFLDKPYVFSWLGLIPERVIADFWVWQIFSYMFIHSTSLFHLLFNMLTLWWMGADLETRWGGRFFLTYYLVCGIGAGLIYLLGMVSYYLITGHFEVMLQPVIGASGAVFGLMLAYGLIFGERVLFFMMLFPMKAKYFVLFLGGIEVVSLLGAGEGSNVSNLAHLGGLLVGYLFLRFWAYYNNKSGKRGSKRNKKKGSRLRLVVDNEKDASRADSNGPRYWN